ncbi:SDR family NAD(P)-dependent oxidoreductase [Cryomorpha ignava]|uniref:SDR family NAD(P)-dependent oxidoreductase n=1 Tax=Cryomorpha ignava TaxID=101383 RepID=A0A7K3WT01_9FLAO|nr:SDR family NAD(P)-dependent oxidoreductase [Cryomorpha ignava]NEN24823.1 SDR family NAD(P)-dependent oxidoreductase [Cryomorpha ignava]
MADSDQKVAIVTGANKGIGFEISRQLCFKGYKVYMCSRNTNRIMQSSGLLRGEGHNVVPTILDVTDPESIDNLLKILTDSGDKIDALVNNAAVLPDDQKSILDLSRAEILLTLETNTVAPLIMTKALLPFMNKGCRVVMLSSTAGSFCKDEIGSWAPIYSLSKTALNAVTRQLAPVLAKKDITVNAVCPGWTRTAMGGSNAPRSVDQGAETPVWLATEVEKDKTGKFWRDKKEISW